jgi:hypothetical protein
MKEVDKYYDLIELLGERVVLAEWLCYSTRDEIKEFVEHCEQHYIGEEA